jgi:hypothetical protein
VICRHLSAYHPCSKSHTGGLTALATIGLGKLTVNGERIDTGLFAKARRNAVSTLVNPIDYSFQLFTNLPGLGLVLQSGYCYLVRSDSDYVAPLHIIELVRAMKIGTTSDFRGKIGQKLTDIYLQINNGIKLGRGGHTFDVYQVQVKLVDQHEQASPELIKLGYLQWYFYKYEIRSTEWFDKLTTLSQVEGQIQNCPSDFDIRISDLHPWLRASDLQFILTGSIR